MMVEYTAYDEDGEEVYEDLTREVGEIATILMNVLNLDQISAFEVALAFHQAGLRKGAVTIDEPVDTQSEDFKDMKATFEAILADPPPLHDLNEIRKGALVAMARESANGLVPSTYLHGQMDDLLDQIVSSR